MEINEITSDAIKKKIILQCDSTFPHGICQRENSEEIIDRICRFAYFFSVFDGSDSIGYIAFYANDKETNTGYISMIGVIDTYHGKGAGSLLLNKCIEISKSNGMCFLRLEVDKDNSNAIGFYKHEGFRYEKDAGQSTHYMIKAL